MESPETEQRSEVFAVVPSYNHAPFVEKCLRSIIAQTSPPRKLLVIDDGSKDGSPEIIERVLRECPFDSELIARENRGLCATLNEAFALSEGNYFAYLGSDDLWLPDFLREQTRLLDGRPDSVLAFSHAYVIDEDSRITDSTDKWTEFADGDLRPLLLRGVVFSSPGVLYRRKALEKLRWNEDARLEDYEMYLKLSGLGEFARNPKILCAWRRHGINSSTDLPAMFPEMIAAQDRVASDLGVSPDELRSTQKQMKFAAAENFIRHGFRREAAKLFLENLDGASSISHIASTAFRLAIPQSLFRWNRRRKQELAVQRRGSLNDVMKPADRR
ncbi:MAG TPA: glycosyltransferase [Pyrinomonadaceae bacterium]|nr:glycosyltransferase [Pyrinomonadaceae bacterium]